MRNWARNTVLVLTAAVALPDFGCGACPCLKLEGTPPEAASEEAPASESDGTDGAVEKDTESSEAGTEMPAPVGLSDTAEAPWWNIPYPEPFDASGLNNRLDFISVKGNRFVNESGETVIFQGVSIGDPDKLRREGHWTPELFEVIASWGANIVRVPVHPAAWRGLGKEKYFVLLDQAVTWADAHDLYLIIDWHSIGNLATGMFQHAMYETDKQETYDFWRAVSFRYQGVAAAAFYEIFNEPTIYNGNLGAMSWEEWKQINEEIISIIYSHDKRVIPLVAGFNWAYELSGVKKNPVDRAGIGYVSHPYPQKTVAPFEKNWTRDFGYVSEKYPLFVTEIGYMRPDAPGAHNPVKDDGSYGKRMTDYLAKRGLSWTAWCFHPHWPPQLISDWDYTPTESGAFLRSVMQQRGAASK